MSLFTIFSFSNSFASVLPAGYTELEYIESSGTQYIDTGYKWTSNITQTYIRYWSIPTSEYALFGSQTSYPKLVYSGFIHGYTNRNAFMCGKTAWIQLTQDSSIFDKWVELNVKTTSDTAGTIDWSDRTNGEVSFSYENGVMNNDTIYLFGNHRDNQTVFRAKVRISSFKMVDNSVVVRNFIPAKRNVDSVLGMYDIANDVFYTNSGTGTFIAGPEVVNTCTSATIMGENVCLIDTEPNGDYINVRYNNEQYYLMLDSENDYPIHVGSSNKLKIITNTATYNVHDASVVE